MAGIMKDSVQFFYVLRHIPFGGGKIAMTRMIWMMAAGFIAYFVKGFCGFANTLVFSSILSFRFDNVNISPVELILGIPANAFLVWKERRYADKKIWIPLTIFMLAGSTGGVLLLKYLDVTRIKSIFGVVVFCVALEMLIRMRQPESSQESSASKASTIGMILTGILSGILCGMFGIGALLAAYVGRATKDTRTFRGSISVVFLIENLYRFVLYAGTGILSAEVIRQAVFLFPCMIAGLGVGLGCAGRLDEKKVKTAVVVMLMISGAVLIRF